LRKGTVASSAHQKIVAVVGTTGFLGPYIVAALLRTRAEPKIVCINVSVDGEQRTTAALANIGVDASSRVSHLRFLIADIAEPATWTAQDGLLAFEVDELIFNAWNPNWSLPLQSFEPLLRAMRNAIDYCTSSSRRPRMVFISSICAVGEWPRKHPGEPLIPENVAWDRSSAMAHGYGESKCIAEQLLARAHAVSGLRVAIVRAGQIGGPAMSAAARSGVWPVQGWLLSLVRASEKTGCWPTHVQPLDWVPVDALAEGVANIAGTTPNGRAVQVFNMVHPRPAPWQLLLDALQDRFGLRAKGVSLPQWLDRLEPGALKLYGFLRAAKSGREYDMAFENQNALAVLPDVMPITEDLLEAWLQGWNLKVRDVKARM
jgi:thioester reductase-like protein